MKARQNRSIFLALRTNMMGPNYGWNLCTFIMHVQPLELSAYRFITIDKSESLRTRENNCAQGTHNNERERMIFC